MLASSYNTKPTSTHEGMDGPHTGKRKRTEEKGKGQIISCKKNRTDTASDLSLTIVQEAADHKVKELTET